MTQPTLVATTSSSYASTGSAAVGASLSWVSGDVVHVLGLTEDNGVTLGTPSAGTNLTLALVTSTNTASNTKAYYWRGTATGSGSGTISASLGGTSGGEGGITAWQYRDTGGQGTAQTIVGSTAKVISVTRTQANSHIIEAMGDWNEAGDVVTDPTPAGGNQRVESAQSGRYDAFVTDWPDQGSTGTTSYGITNHTGTVKMTGIAVEIFGVAGGTSIAVPLGTLALTGQAPTVATTANQTISVPAGSLTLTGQAPTVLTPVSIAVPAGSLSLTANAPAVIATANQFIDVPAGSLTLTGNAPTVAATGGGISIPAGVLTLTALAPTVIATANVTVDVPTGTLTLAANAPQVLTPVVVAPPAGSLTLTALAPTVAVTTNVVIDVPSGSLQIIGYAPDVQGEVIAPVQDTFSGGFLYEYEREQLRRRRRRRELQEREEAAQDLKDRVDREIAQLLARQEAEDDRRNELERLQRMVQKNSKNALQLSDRAKIAYVRALTQANFSAMEALDRELQRMLEEEEVAALMLLLSHE